MYRSIKDGDVESNSLRSRDREVDRRRAGGRIVRMGQSGVGRQAGNMRPKLECGEKNKMELERQQDK